MKKKRKNNEAINFNEFKKASFFFGHQMVDVKTKIEKNFFLYHKFFFLIINFILI